MFKFNKSTGNVHAISKSSKSHKGNEDLRDKIDKIEEAIRVCKFSFEKLSNAHERMLEREGKRTDLPNKQKDQNEVGARVAYSLKCIEELINAAIYPQRTIRKTPSEQKEVPRLGPGRSFGS